MNLFNWLLIGHLIGDWLLQNDRMARGKRANVFNLACIIHCIVYTLSVVATLWLTMPWVYPANNLLAFSLLLFLSHWLIDALNLAAHWGRLLRQTDVAFVRIVVDQSMHLIVLALLAQWLQPL